jgi:hypothetical protein
MHTPQYCRYISAALGPHMSSLGRILPASSHSSPPPASDGCPDFTSDQLVTLGAVAQPEEPFVRNKAQGRPLASHEQGRPHAAFSREAASHTFHSPRNTELLHQAARSTMVHSHSLQADSSSGNQYTTRIFTAVFTGFRKRTPSSASLIQSRLSYPVYDLH